MTKRIVVLLGLVVILGGLPAVAAADICAAPDCCHGMKTAKSKPDCCEITSPVRHRVLATSVSSFSGNDEGVRHATPNVGLPGLSLVAGAVLVVSPEGSPHSRQERLGARCVLLI